MTKTARNQPSWKHKAHHQRSKRHIPHALLQHASDGAFGRQGPKPRKGERR